MILASVNETLYGVMLEAVNTSTSHARELYGSFNQINEAYTSGLENATKQVELINKSITGLAQADKGYVKAYKEATKPHKCPRDLGQNARGSGEAARELGTPKPAIEAAARVLAKGLDRGAAAEEVGY